MFWCITGCFYLIDHYSIELFSASKQTDWALFACHSEWVTVALHSTILNIHWRCTYSNEHCLVVTCLWPHEAAAILVHIMCILYIHAPVYSVIQSHIHMVDVCSAAACHLHFWQNDGGYFLCYCSNMEWNAYRNKSQHRKLTLEKKIIRREAKFRTATMKME